MIKEYVSVLAGVCTRLTKLEETIAALTERIDRAASVIDTPSGFVAMNAVTKSKPDELEQMLRNPMVHHLESVDVEFHVTSAIYMAALPDFKDKLKKLFTSAELDNIRSMVEMHQKMLDLTMDMERRIEEVNRMTHEARLKVQNEVESYLASRTTDEVNKLAAIRHAFDQRIEVLDAKLREVTIAVAMANTAGAKATALVESRSDLPNKIAVGR